jgi:selenocysteine-specific elongation factor
MHVIGTAGHVDHGKSVLVKALTGIDPDRLQEEKDRGMTIDLGFAWMALPSGREVSIVDVPGHEDFIKNMLAGVGGIELALLVVAADEGIMPQTREHLAILDLLGVMSCVVAITKVDLIDEASWDSPEEWLELVQIEVEELLDGTTLASAQIVPVSALTGEGLPELVEALDSALSDFPPPLVSSRPRLPVDRVFTLSGFGTVVTGTLIGGPLSVGDDVEIVPPLLRARIRGLQTHKRSLDGAVPGSRVAINLTGVDTNQVQRGHVVTTPGWLLPTRLVDVEVRILTDAPQPLTHNALVTLFVGAAQTPARARVLGQETIAPGTTGYAQFHLSHPAALDANDRFIIRRPSPAVTIGGGHVLDPHPRRRHRRFQVGVLERLQTLAEGTPTEILLHQLRRLEPLPAQSLIEQSQLEYAVAVDALWALTATGEILVLGDEAESPERMRLVGWDSVRRRMLISGAGWERLRGEMISLLASYHCAHPLRRGMPREACRSQLQRRARHMSGRVFDEVVAHAVREGGVKAGGAFLYLAEHKVTFTAEQEAAIESLLAEFDTSPHSPPTAAQCQSEVGEEVLSALVDQGRLIRVSEDVLFAKEAYEEMVDQVRVFTQQEGSITVAQARDLFGSSRRYLLALLEYLDARGVTRRVGDKRVLRH